MPPLVSAQLHATIRRRALPRGHDFRASGLPSFPMAMPSAGRSNQPRPPPGRSAKSRRASPTRTRIRSSTAASFRHALGGGPLVRGGGPFFTDYTVSLENNQQEVSLRDGLGQPAERRFRLVETTAACYGGMYNQNSTLARSCGHLLLISVGTRFVPWIRGRPSGNLPRPRCRQGCADPVDPGPLRHRRPITAET